MSFVGIIFHHKDTKGTIFYLYFFFSFVFFVNFVVNTNRLLILHFRLGRFLYLLLTYNHRAKIVILIHLIDITINIIIIFSF